MQVHFDVVRHDPEYTLLQQGNTLYVHLCSGRIVEITPATAVQVTDRAVIALDGEDQVATFDRDDVYFATDEVMEPPALE